jgi:ketosteroid isomerase-like protein
MSGQSEDIVRSTYEAFAQGDVPSVLGAFAPDIEWYEAEGMPYGGLHRGPDAVAQKVFGPLTEDVENFAVTPQQLIASGDTVAAVVSYTGTGKETGKALNLPVVHVWDVQNGKIARFRQFIDTVRFAEIVPGEVSVVAA